METWLTYTAAFLMAGATAYTFSSSTLMLAVFRSVTRSLTGIGVVFFMLSSFFMIMAGAASLNKDRLVKRTAGISILFSLSATALLSALGAVLPTVFPVSFPVSASAGTLYSEALSLHIVSTDCLGITSICSLLYLPMALMAFILGLSMTPSSDVIRPAYTVINSFSEAMYRISRTAAYFGSIYVYIASTAFFLSLWHEKTVVAVPGALKAILAATAVALLVAIPLLIVIFTLFRKNPYGVIGRTLGAALTGLVSSNIYLTLFPSLSFSRSNLGIQKRFSSTLAPLSAVVNRGGTAFVSILCTVTLLRTLGADLSGGALIAIAVTGALLSFTSFLNAGFETAALTALTLSVLKINAYGAEAALVSLIPLINGLGVMLDTVLYHSLAAVIGKNTKTDTTIPLKDTI